MGGEVEVWCKELNWPCTASDTPYHVFMSIILLKNVPLPNNKVKITAWIFQLEPIKYKYLFNTLILEIPQMINLYLNTTNAEEYNQQPDKPAWHEEVE